MEKVHSITLFTPLNVFFLTTPQWFLRWLSQTGDGGGDGMDGRHTFVLGISLGTDETHSFVPMALYRLHTRYK
jgi:hypothetical protein